MMSAGRRKLAARLVDGAVGVVTDRAPALSERAYRAVATPMMRVDPSGGARAADARLDGVRNRVATMSARGRVRPAEARRVQRDLTRTREDLDLLAPRLPAVRSHGLALRLAAYTAVLTALAGPPAVGSRSTRVRDVALLAGSVTAWIGLLVVLTGNLATSVVAGLAAGFVTATVAVSVQARRVGQVRIGALSAALGEIDTTTRAPVEILSLDSDRRALIERAQASGRLDQRGTTALTQITAHLDDLLIRLLEGDLGADASHLVKATISRYLPDTLEPFLALNDPQVVVRGHAAVVEVASQLAAIETGLAGMVQRPRQARPEASLFLQGEFLRAKFGSESDVPQQPPATVIGQTPDRR